MNIDSIKTGITKLPRTALKGVNTIGSATIKSKNNVAKFVSNHTQNFAKSESISNSVNRIKESAANVQLPDFVKTAVKFVKDHKETIVGSIVVLAAISCARKIIKAMTGNIQETALEKKQQTVGAHQG